MTGARNKMETSRGREVGDTMPDGTVYAGISPDTGKPFYTTPDDAPLTVRWEEAMEFAAAFRGHGHKNWRVPTKAELNVLFNNRAVVGGSDFAGWYWSSTEHPDHADEAWLERFSDGNRHWLYKTNVASLRCVR